MKTSPAGAGGALKISFTSALKLRGRKTPVRSRLRCQMPASSRLLCSAPGVLSRSSSALISRSSAPSSVPGGWNGPARFHSSSRMPCVTSAVASALASIRDIASTSCGLVIL